MKKLLIFLLLFPVSLTAQEKYFHELRGMEDSTGTTHLFYRMYEEFDLQGSCGIDWENNIYHLNTSTQEDSVMFSSFYKSLRCTERENDFQDISDFEFRNNNFDEKFTAEISIGFYSNAFGTVNAFNGSFFDAGWFPIQNLEITNTDSSNFAILGVDDYESAYTLIITMNNDSLPSRYYDRPLLVKAVDKCYEFQSFFCAESDSLKILDYAFSGLNPNTNEIFLQRNDSLFISSNFGDSIYFLNNGFSWGEFSEFIFSPDSINITAYTRNSFLRDSRKSKYQIIRSRDAGQTWQPILRSFNTLEGNTVRIFPSDYIDTELGASLDFYAGAGMNLYYWNQLPSSFYKIYDFESQISGIYIKSYPNYEEQDVYVLTKKELFLYKFGEVTSLKKLPVSNEEPKETPSSIKLHQNYPNPFNPSTTISFELDRPTEVILTIFDALGRVMSVLVDEQRTTGLHEISFDASSLSSGIYFYRLESGAFSETKRFTLIK